jgi:hypothetical protein
VEDQFSLDRMVAATLAVYDDLLAGRSPRRGSGATDPGKGSA